MFVEAKEIANVLGGKSTLGLSVAHDSDLEKLVLDGMPMGAIENVFRLFSPKKSKVEMHLLLHVVFHENENARYNELKRAVIDQDKTMKKNSKARAETDESERAERLARIYAMTFKVLGNKILTRSFLFSKHPMLGGNSPIEKLETEIGARQVERILFNSMYGLPA
jgi:putative toxin-antitoxin system antitoxin component (TIGR02293 family)